MIEQRFHKLQQACAEFIQGKRSSLPLFDGGWLITHTHPSRLENALSLFPAESRPFFESDLHAFPSAFLKRILAKKILGELKNTPTSPPSSDDLVTSSPAIFEKTCFLLGLYDLVIDLQGMLDASIVKKVQQALTKEEILFMQNVIARHKPIRFEPIGLVQWDQKPATLRALLLMRGLHRLGLAVSSRPEILSYLELKLDPEQAALLLRFAQKQAPPSQISTLNEELEQSLRYAHEMDLR